MRRTITTQQQCWAMTTTTQAAACWRASSWGWPAPSLPTSACALGAITSAPRPVRGDPWGSVYVPDGEVAEGEHFPGADGAVSRVRPVRGSPRTRKRGRRPIRRRDRQSLRAQLTPNRRISGEPQGGDEARRSRGQAPRCCETLGDAISPGLARAQILVAQSGTHWKKGGQNKCTSAQVLLFDIRSHETLESASLS